MFKKIFNSTLIVMLSIACAPKNNETSLQGENVKNGGEIVAPATQITFARHFDVQYGPGYKLLEVKDPWPQAERSFRYLLVDKGTESPEVEADLVIEIPLDNIVCTSTSHIPLLDLIGKSEKLIAFPNTDFISSPLVRALIDQGKVADLGPLAGLNIESLLALNPDLVMGHGTGDQTRTFQSISNLGIPVVLNGDYMEETALGRAEWIKFGALFFNMEEAADSVFDAIVQRYNSLAHIAKPIDTKSSVFSGILYGDTWFMPGGKNYSAQFLYDAGGNFIWDDNPETGWMELSFEAVYEKAHAADKWIGVASFNSLQEMDQSDHRYGQFKAFSEGEVYSYNARIGAKGGFEYMELGYARPDLILADLIKILYPDLLPDHELFFYKKLN